jgi:chromosome segregation ATPase
VTAAVVLLISAGTISRVAGGPVVASQSDARAGGAGQSGSTADVLPALLVEVKGLRAAMEQMASAGPSVQLFVSRLQLQEARMNTMIRRLDSVRDSLASEQRASEDAQEAQTRTETALASGTAVPGRDELTQLLAHVKREVAEHKAAGARLTAEEGQLSQDLAVEQGRWNDINQRLDELERALTKR